MNRIGFLAASLILAASVAGAQTERRSAYSYVREVSGQVTVISGLNGTIEARTNLPISGGDEVRTDDPGRAEISLADGSVLHVGGGSAVQFVALSGQQGSDDEVSALALRDGSLVLSVIGSEDRVAPRIDTDDVTVYTNPGSRVRVNSDSRRGTAVVVRAGSVEVKTPAGSYTVRAGNYMLAHGDEEPEVARGSFSRDRFDAWAADRLQSISEAPRNASSQYVGEDNSSDVSSLDGNGNWDYSASYSTYVWRPTVAAGWTPYSNGSWYYTPAGLTWWSFDSWGWYPFHYGNWFFDSGWNSWCWAPGSVYSPAWVYWGYTSSYVGWCPIGWYGGFSPWWNDYYRHWSYPRAGLAFAINGTFPTRRVDFRGWNFTGSQGFGSTRGRVEIVPGSRVGDRLGGSVAISSRPIVVSGRTGVGVRDSLQNYVREAPRVIERNSSPDSQRLEPVLARDRVLPAATVDAMRGRAVVAERGRLSGPGASDLAPRGSTIVDRGRGSVHVESTRRIETDRATGRTVLRDGGRTADGADHTARPDVRRAEPQSQSPTQDSWRGRPATDPSSRPADSGRSVNRDPRADSAKDGWRSPSTGAGRPQSDSSNSEASRGSRNAPSQGAPRAESANPSREDWRNRGQVPPARRVIEGAVPNRRSPDNGGSGRQDDFAPRSSAPSGPREAPQSIDRSQPPSQSAPAPRAASPPSHSAPPPSHSAPQTHSAPAPAPRSAPPPSGSKPGRS